LTLTYLTLTYLTLARLNLTGLILASLGLVRLVLGNRAADQQTDRCEQNSENSSIRINPEHERDSCQTTFVQLF